MNFEYSDEYARRFADVAERQFSTRMFPIELIEGWESLVESIKQGYNDIPPEYDNDVDTARKPIQTFLVEDELACFPEHQTFKTIISELDKEFVQSTQIHPQWVQDEYQWWSNRVPKQAGRQYLEFFNAESLEEIGLTIILVE